MVRKYEFEVRADSMGEARKKAKKFGKFAKVKVGKIKKKEMVYVAAYKRRKKRK